MDKIIFPVVVSISIAKRSEINKVIYYFEFYFLFNCDGGAIRDIVQVVLIYIISWYFHCLIFRNAVTIY